MTAGRQLAGARRASLMRRGEVNGGLLLQVVGPNDSGADVVSNVMMSWERALQNA